MKKFYKLMSVCLFVCLVMQTSKSFSQTNCGCDITLTPTNPTDDYLYLDGSKLGIKPGSKICIKAGTYNHIQLFNFQGTATQPLTFINCGGQVVCANPGNYGGIILNNCRYFRFTGTGDPNYKYGFNIGLGSSVLPTGFSLSTRSSDFECDHIEISNVQAGFFFTYVPTCDSTSWSTYFTSQNVSFHDNYIHDTQHEGMYLGNTSMTYDITCNGATITKQPQHINNMKVYNNLLERTGWDGIQCSNTPVGLDVYNNTIRSYGAANMQVQQAGIILGGGTNGKIHENFIDGGTGNGIQVLGVGTEQIYNNVIANAGYDGTTNGQDAIIIDDRPNPNSYPHLQVQLINNTFVSPKRTAVQFYNDYGTVGTGNVFENNIVVAPGLGKYFAIGNNITVQQITNLLKPTVAEAGFVNAGSKDYHLLATSAAVNTGTNSSSYGVTKDLDGNARPYGSAYDIGAYEYTGTSTPPANQPPTANAGPDQSITLPTNSVTLNGTASKDSDGTIASYKWTYVSGPTTYTIANATAATTAVSNLVQGAYVFRLTVTDDKGATATDDVAINVAAATTNQPPVANAGPDINIVLPTNSVTLNGTASKDPDGSIASYKWTYVSGPTTYTIANANASTTTFSNLVHGAYVMRLTVTDNSGATASDDITVNVAVATNLPPVASAGSNVTITLPTNTVQLNGSASSDPDGTIASYLWTESSGPTYTINNAALVSPTLTNLVQGVYIFNLKVTDNNGATGNAQVTITVNAQAITSNVGRIRVLIDAGPATSTTPSPDSWGKYWNNMTDGRAGVRISNAKDTANRATSVSLEVINRIDGTFSTSGDGTNGGNTTGIVGDYPATATNDFIFAHESTTVGKWRIYGLDSTMTYTVKFWGSKSYASQRIIRIKRSDQTAWQSYDAEMNIDYNRAAKFTVSGLKEVSFDIQVQSGTFGYINVIDIIGVNGGTPAARTSGPLEVSNNQPATEEAIAREQLSVYPNPARNQSQLVIRNNYIGNVKITVINTSGSVLNEMNVFKDQNTLLHTINVSNFASGVYYIRMQLGTSIKLLKLVRD